MNVISPHPPKACRPFGNPDTAEVWVIGHDPRLRKSSREADVCFFLNLLEAGPMRSARERAALRLATRVKEYVQQLTGKADVGSFYVTNLCNTFLEKPQARGVILIDDPVAEAGAREIQANLNAARRKPKAIITMSQQVLYHLVRTNSLESAKELLDFQEASVPKEKRKAQRIYEPLQPRAFVKVCGNRYSWGGVPVVPVLHISSYRRIRDAYREPMHCAERTLRALVADAP
jgi:hypothetical protein